MKTDLGTFDLFRNLKYNNNKEWSLLKDYAHSIKTGELSLLADLELYKSINNEIDRTLIGVKTANGIYITGKSKHFIARTIGSVEQRRNGVSTVETQKAVTEPVRIDSAIINSNGKSQRFMSNKAAVTINLDTGRLIQVNH